MIAQLSEDNRFTRTITTVSVALLAVLFTQVLHELTHAVAGLLVADTPITLTLFAVDTGSIADRTPMLIVAGSAALVNILVGFIAVVVFHRGNLPPVPRLFVMYTAAYNLFTGFGYLFIDAMFYNPENLGAGDWQQVLLLLDGNSLLRVVMFVIGAGGLVWGFFWLARAAWRFVPDVTDEAQRIRYMLPVLMLPYLIINITFVILSTQHPLGGQGVFVTAMQYWFGYIGFFWAYFLAANWLEVNAQPTDTTPLPAQPIWSWTGLALVVFIVANILLIPGVNLR